MQITSGWAGVKTKHLSEEVAEKSIREVGYRVYLPRYQKKLQGHRAGSRAAPVMRPLFPRYLFVEVHPGQRVAPIIYARGVEDLIWRAGDIGAGDDRRPSLVPHDLIEEIRRKEKNGEFDAVNRKRLDIKPDDAVRITEGPYAAFIGTLVEFDDDERALVMLTMFNRPVPIRFPETIVVAVTG